MGLFDSIKEAFGFKQPEEKPARTASFAIPKEVARKIPGFDYSHTWTCKCGANLKIRTRVDRAEGPSNFHPDLPAGDLNWNGLAVERGWKVEPVMCPACLNGKTLAEYKEARRK